MDTGEESEEERAGKEKAAAATAAVASQAGEESKRAEVEMALVEPLSPQLTEQEQQQAEASEKLMHKWGHSAAAEAKAVKEAAAAIDSNGRANGMKHREKVALLVGLSCRSQPATMDTPIAVRTNMARAVSMTVRYPTTQILTLSDGAEESAMEDECWPGRHTTAPIGQGHGEEMKQAASKIQQRAKDGGIHDAIKIDAIYCEFAKQLRPNREQECAEVAQFLLPAMLESGMLRNHAFALFPHPAPVAPSTAAASASAAPPPLLFAHSGAKALAAVFQAQSKGADEAGGIALRRLKRVRDKATNQVVEQHEQVHPVFESFFPTAHPLVLTSMRMQKQISLRASLSDDPPSVEESKKGEEERRAHLMTATGFCTATELEGLRPDAPFIRVEYKSGIGAKAESMASFKRVFMDNPANNLSSLFYKQRARLQCPTLLAPATIAGLAARCPRPTTTMCEHARQRVELEMAREPDPTKRAYGAEELRSILIHLREWPARVSPMQLEMLAGAEFQRDFHNNWGSQFFEPLHQTEFKTIILRMAHSSCQQMQTGRGSDHNTVANQLMDDLQYAVRAYFGQRWMAATIATHSTDVIGQSFLATYLLNKPKTLAEVTKRQKFIPETDPRRAAILYSLPGTYFAQAFVAAAEGMRNGMLCRMVVTRHDPSVSIGAGQATLGSTAQRELERATLMELQEYMVKHRTDEQRNLLSAGEAIVQEMIIEPIGVPGNGRIYSKPFLREVARLCEKNNVTLIADESITWGRVKHPLVSSGVRDFEPTMVIIGKSIGGAMLLLNDKKVHKGQTPAGNESLTRSIQAEMENNYSFVASPDTILDMTLTLQQAQRTQVHATCHQRETEWRDMFLHLLADLTHPETRSRGIGACWWLCTALARLMMPIMMVSGGRMLPRANTVPNELLRSVQLAPALFLEACSMGADAVTLIRIASCAFCGDMIFEQNEPAEAASQSSVESQMEQAESMACSNCPRQYHSRCQQTIKQSEKRFTDAMIGAMVATQASTGSATSKRATVRKPATEELEDDFADIEPLEEGESIPFSCICGCCRAANDLEHLLPLQQPHDELWMSTLGQGIQPTDMWSDRPATPAEQLEEESDWEVDEKEELQARRGATRPQLIREEQKDEAEAASSEAEETRVAAGNVKPQLIAWKVTTVNEPLVRRKRQSTEGGEGAEKKQRSQGADDSSQQK